MQILRHIEQLLLFKNNSNSPKLTDTHCVKYTQMRLLLCLMSVSGGPKGHRTITINFQNNAQVQINTWFKLTPGTKHTVYNL